MTDLTIPAKPKTCDRPPPMHHHTPKEFLFAEKILSKMVLDSNIFPERAASSEWFRPHNRGDRRPTSRMRKLLGLVVSEADAETIRRPSWEESTTPKSIGTASTASMTSSPNSEFGLSPSSPIVPRRNTIDMTSLESLGLPLAGSPGDGNRPSGSGLARRASSDKLQLVETETIAPNNDNATKTTSPKEAYKEYSAVQSVHEKDIDYGEILGKGGFCEVRMVKIKYDKGCKYTASKDPNKRYAMKYLSPTKLVPKTPPNKDDKKPLRNKQFERGIADLAIEARFLTLLSHENIITVHYVGEGRLDQQFNCEGENNYYHRFGFFLLLDPLFETLTHRIDETYVPQMFRGFDNNGRVGLPLNNKGSSISSSTSSGSSSWWKRVIHMNHSSINDLPLDSWRMQLIQRLEALKGVASALQYLHDECRVIYRDLKPDNIGFYRKPHPLCSCGKRSKQPQTMNELEGGCTCYTEIPKLFDFGLAKELKPKYLKAHPHYQDANVDTFNLTARSGSRRYMAPEVAFSTPYNEKADVYSFGIVLYQVASLVTPFEGYSLYKHEEEVLSLGDRPDIKIPCTRRSYAKIKKNCMVVHADWARDDDIEKKNKLLASRTKSVWTKELKFLIDDCWHDDMRRRPHMRDVVTMLDGCIRELTMENNRASQGGARVTKTRKGLKASLSKTESLRDSSMGHDIECLSH